jgi:hypothetical protein
LKKFNYLSDDITGYELKFQSVLKTESYCIQLMKVNNDVRLNDATLRLTIKDPDVFPTNNELFYGKLTVNSLFKCKKNKICATVNNDISLNVQLPETDKTFKFDEDYQKNKFSRLNSKFQDFLAFN